MLEENGAKNKKHDDECPDWEEISIKIYLKAAGFILAIWIFSVAVSDIRGYFEDHNMIRFDLFNSLATIIFLIIFFALPRIILDIYNRSTPSKNYSDNKSFYIISLLITLISMIFVLIYIFPLLVPVKGEERDALWITVSYWLLSLFVINILFDYSVSKEVIRRPINFTLKKIRGLTDRSVPHDK